MLVVQSALSAAVDSSHHIVEVVHADICSASFSEKAIVEFPLVLFCVVWGIPDRVAILLLRVASPHTVDGLFAGKEIIALLL